MKRITKTLAATIATMITVATAVWLANILPAAACADYGGIYDPAQSTCLVDGHEEYILVFDPPLKLWLTLVAGLLIEAAAVYYLALATVRGLSVKA